MKNKFKKVYSLAHQAGYRNYTVKDLINLKGKKKLTQINVVSAEEAAAAEAAGIDMIICGVDQLKEIREAAPNTFLTCGIKYTEYASKESIMKKVFELLEVGGESALKSEVPVLQRQIHCAGTTSVIENNVRERIVADN